MNYIYIGIGILVSLAVTHVLMSNGEVGEDHTDEYDFKNPDDFTGIE